MTEEQTVEQLTVTVSSGQALLAAVGRKGWSAALCALMLLLVSRYMLDYVDNVNPVIPSGIDSAVTLLVRCCILVSLANCALRIRTWGRARRIADNIETGSVHLRWIGHHLDLDWAREMGRRGDCDGVRFPYPHLGSVFPGWATLLLMVVCVICVVEFGVRIGISNSAAILALLIVWGGIHWGFDSLFPAYIELAGQTLALSGMRQRGGESSAQQVIPLESASVRIWAIEPSLMTFSWDEDGSHHEAALRNLPIEVCYYVFCAAIPPDG